tara:strand:- start:183 stop:428 length:246 start_codon:yes stop_codon:yes gene_type:complete
MTTITQTTRDTQSAMAALDIDLFIAEQLWRDSRGNDDAPPTPVTLAPMQTLRVLWMRDEYSDAAPDVLKAAYMLMTTTPVQ